MNKKLKLTLLATTISLALAGCSSDNTETVDNGDTPDTGNSAPIISVTSQNSVSLDENETVVVNYNISDSDIEHDESNLSVSYELLEIDSEDLVGDLVLDQSSKTLTYSVGNIQEDYTFSVLLNVVDPEGEEASNSEGERTVTFSVTNSENESPEIVIAEGTTEDGTTTIVVEGTNSANEEQHTVNIPFGVKDADNDELTFNLSEITGLTTSRVRFADNDGSSGMIIATFDKEYTQNVEGDFTLTVDDKNEPASMVIKLLVEKTEISPTIDINKNEVSSGVIPFEVEEDGSIDINFATEDLNGDQVFVTAELSNQEVVGNFNPNVTSNSINLGDFNVQEDTLITLTLTANDRTGTEVATDSVEINIKDTVNSELNEVNENIELEREKFSSMNSRNDELTLFEFYVDYLSLTEQVTTSEKEMYLEQIESGRATEISEVESVISEIEREQTKSEEEQDVVYLSDKFEELQEKVNQIGISGINVLNTLAQIDDSLLMLDNVSKIYLADEDSNGSNKKYSRYVGNSELGFYKNDMTWEFLNEYEVLEMVNFMSGQCN